MTAASQDALTELLRPSRLTAVVDVGANPIDGDPPYKPMLDRGLCTVVGFDPQQSAIDKLKGRGPLETYLSYALGDGTDRTLYECQEPGMTSMLQPDPRTLNVFRLFEDFGKVVTSHTVQTRTLDSIDEIGALDLFKIDVQGSELTILRSGKRKLAQAVAVQTEVSFLPLYKDQPCIGDIDLELRSQGFVPHAIAELKQWAIAPMVLDNDPRKPLNQLLEADLVYVRDFRSPGAFTDEQLKHLALIAHHCYGSADLALHCVIELQRRGRVAEGSSDRYLGLLRTRK